MAVTLIEDEKSNKQSGEQSESVVGVYADVVVRGRELDNTRPVAFTVAEFVS